MTIRLIDCPGQSFFGLGYCDLLKLCPYILLFLWNVMLIWKCNNVQKEGHLRLLGICSQTTHIIMHWTWTFGLLWKELSYINFVHRLAQEPLDQTQACLYSFWCHFHAPHPSTCSRAYFVRNYYSDHWQTHRPYLSFVYQAHPQWKLIPWLWLSLLFVCFKVGMVILTT